MIGKVEPPPRGAIEAAIVVGPLRRNPPREIVFSSICATDTPGKWWTDVSDEAVRDNLRILELRQFLQASILFPLADTTAFGANALVRRKRLGYRSFFGSNGRWSERRMGRAKRQSATPQDMAQFPEMKQVCVGGVPIFPSSSRSRDLIHRSSHAL